jgi:competence protein ComEC
MNRPLVAITISFILGIVFSPFAKLDPGVVLLLALAIFCIAIGCYIAARPDSPRVFILLFFVLGWAVARLDAAGTPEGPERFAGHFITLDGMVITEPQVRTGDVVYHLAAGAVILGDRRVETRGLVQVKVEGNGPVYSYGDRLLARGALYLPRAPGNFGAFDYRAYLERRGINALMKVKRPEDVRLVGTGGGNAAVRLALRVKQRLIHEAERTLDDRQTAVLSGLLFGGRGGLDDDIQEVFNRTGVAHVLSVSGLHVGYVLAGVLLLAGALNVPRRVIPFVALPVLIFYAVMTGAGPAVLRASIMAMVVLAATQLGRERDWPSALALAALLILIARPAILYETGFQLSFAATWGILYLGPPLGELLHGRWALPGWLALPLQVTVAAQLGTLPLLVYYFNLLAPVAPLANLLLVPLVGLIMLFGFTGCTAGIVFTPLGGMVNAGTGLLIDFFLELANLINRLPGGSVYLATPPWYAVFLWYAGLILLVEMLKGNAGLPGAERTKRIAPAAVGALLLLLILWPWSGTGGRMEVHFIDVGQGDSILVRFPGGRTMLVDAGGKMGDLEGGRVVGDATVVPYLRRLGINKLDVLVITHPHGDHAGGVPAVVEKLDVGAVVTSPAPGLEELLSGHAFSRVPVYRVEAGQSLQIDRRVEVLVLGPDGRSPAGEDLNNASVVLRLDYGDISFLLTGDVEEEAQRAMLAAGLELEADILKVPHHGSRFFEPCFFSAVSPEYAVIQVGERNRFGHPAQETLDALLYTGAEIFRTDRDGAVMFSTDGRQITVKTAR